MVVPVLVAVWLLSNIACIYLTKKRRVTPGIFLRFIGALLGPFAIPLVFLLKPKPATPHA
jgi:hypothetical protein